MFLLTLLPVMVLFAGFQLPFNRCGARAETSQTEAIHYVMFTQPGSRV